MIMSSLLVNVDSYKFQPKATLRKLKNPAILKVISELHKVPMLHKIIHFSVLENMNATAFVQTHSKVL